MPIDPNIALGVRYQPIDSLGLLMQRRQMDRQDYLDRQNEEDRKAAREDRATLRADRIEDRRLAAEDRTRALEDRTRALAEHTEDRTRAKKNQAIEDELQQIDVAIKKADVMGRVLASVTDQATYDGALNTLGRFGLDTSGFGKGYDKAAVDQYLTQANMLRSKLNDRVHWLTKENPDGTKTAVSVPDVAGQSVPLGKDSSTTNTKDKRQFDAEKWRAEEYSKLYERRRGKPSSDPFVPGIPPLSQQEYESEVQRIENGYQRLLGQYGMEGVASVGGPAAARRVDAQKRGVLPSQPGEKPVSIAELRAIAAKNGTTYEQERRRAQEAGYVVR